MSKKLKKIFDTINDAAAYVDSISSKTGFLVTRDPESNKFVATVNVPDDYVEPIESQISVYDILGGEKQ